MQADVAILDEPEHLTWFHHGIRWTDKFNHVVSLLSLKVALAVSWHSCAL